MVAGNSGRGLCDYFDYIGGTSTGAIILARGMMTADIIDFYRSSGAQMFEHARLIERVKYFYTADPLKLRFRSRWSRSWACRAAVRGLRSCGARLIDDADPEHETVIDIVIVRRCDVLNFPA